MSEILDTAGDERAKLGPFLAALLVATGMIGSGVYLLPASLGAVGSVSILGWLGALAGASLLAGVFAGLAGVNPQGQGLFSHVRQAFGPGAGFVVGLLYWFPVANLPVAMAVTGYLSVFFPALAHGAAASACTIAVLWLAVGVNIVSPAFVARLGGWTLVVGVAPVLLVATAGWLAFHPAVFAASWNLTGKTDLAAAAGSVTVIFWAFVGIENAIIISPLMRNPARNVGVATFAGLAFAAVLYLASSAAIMGMIPAASLAKSSAPFADASRLILGASLAGAVALCALTKAFGALAGSVLITVETAESDAVLGQILPDRAPRRADQPARLNLILLGLLMSVLTAASTSPTLGRQFALAAEISVLFNLMAYLAACLALLRFSGRAPGWRRWLLIAAGLGGAVFCCVAVAISEAALIAWTASAVVAATLAWAAIRFRRRKLALA